MNNEYGKRNPSDNISDRNLGITEDFEGIRRPSADINANGRTMPMSVRSGPAQNMTAKPYASDNVRRPQRSVTPQGGNGANIGTAGSDANSTAASRTARRQASPQANGTAGGQTIRRPLSSQSANSASGQPSRRNVTSQPGVSVPQQRRAVSGQKHEGASERRTAQKRPLSSAHSQGAFGTRDIDRESLRRAKKSRDVRESRENYNEPEDDGGSSAVMSLIKAILYIVVVVAVAGLLSYYIIVFANDMYAFVKNAEEVEVTIPEYATVEEIADILGEAGVVKYPDLLVIYAKIKDIDKTYEFIAGDYTVNGMMNYDELFYAFVKQKSYEVVRITIPEGYTVDEMIALFTENGIGTREKFIDVINNYPFEYDFVKALDEVDKEGRIYRLEGYLYPDTYEFYKGSSEVTVIAKLLNRFDVIFSDDFYKKAEELGYTVDEIMTLASMIEKEARYSQDYETVSSVFHNDL
ncbi:MAG: endolytic transglycosylase MltG [Clostridia bacterium]|nr:endolytic transglycosylase MltG [Clostridia bacterium]